MYRFKKHNSVLFAPVRFVQVCGLIIAVLFTITSNPHYAVSAQGIDGLRSVGGSGSGRTLYATSLSDPGIVGGVSLEGGWSPGWIGDDNGNKVWDGGVLTERAFATKGLFGFEIWGAFATGQAQRVTETAEWLINFGDWNLGAKYSFALSSQWHAAPFVSLRLLSPVEDESTIGDTVSFEAGGAVSWSGSGLDKPVPLQVVFNFSYDYDNSYLLLSKATQQKDPATPFERISWNMTQWPNLRTSLLLDVLLPSLSKKAVAGIELDASVPLVTNEFGLGGGLYSATASWRQLIKPNLMYAVDASFDLPANYNALELPGQQPWSLGVLVAYRLGGDFRADYPVDEIVAKAVEPASDAATGTTNLLDPAQITNATGADEEPTWPSAVSESSATTNTTDLRSPTQITDPTGADDESSFPSSVSESSATTNTTDLPDPTPITDATGAYEESSSPPSVSEPAETGVNIP